uniref:Protection of telomeres 1 protein n=1 Tax=Solanum tuberosum TaxID=4113 RepID=M1BWJ1_SOLTU
MENPLPLQPVDFILQRDVLCTLPPLGTVLRVIVDRCNEKLGINFLKSNRWVKLINIRCELHAALWHAVLMPFTRVCYLSDEDDIVLQRMSQYDERRKSKWGWMPLSSFPWSSDIAETDYPNVPFVSLMRALANPKVIGKFHCVVRVVAAFPWLAEDFRSPSGVYRIRLTLEDPTARIHAYLYKEDAVIIVCVLAIFYQSFLSILQHIDSHLGTVFHDIAQYKYVSWTWISVFCVWFCVFVRVSMTYLYSY